MLLRSAFSYEVRNNDELPNEIKIYLMNRIKNIEEQYKEND